jgi:hypothetical protein
MPLYETNFTGIRFFSGNDRLIIFSDGVPVEYYEDRNTVALSCGQQTHILDLESSVIDFFVQMENS